MSNLIVDLGGSSMKLGFSCDYQPKIIDNYIFKSKTLSGRTFVAHEIENCNNLSSLYCITPFKKGYVNNWETQIKIFDVTLKKIFSENANTVSDTNLLITEPYFNFSSTKETMNEIFFEEYQFAGLLRTNPAFLAAYKYQCESARRISRYCLVIDTGFSFTHIVPMCDGRVMREFVLRLPIGGKILTNRLIEIVSYRHLDVRSEMYIMNQCKEDVCYVATDFWRDMRTAQANPKRNDLVREYVLPDYVEVHRGFVKESSSDLLDRKNAAVGASGRLTSAHSGYSLRLCNERFTVPELLFHPSDVGYKDMGLTEAMRYLMYEKLPAAVRPGAWINSLVIGGNARFPGFTERLQNDLRSMAPDDLPVNVFKPSDPLYYAWQGGSLLANNPEKFTSYLVTRAEYEEHGSRYCEQRFPVS